MFIIWIVLDSPITHYSLYTLNLPCFLIAPDSVMCHYNEHQMGNLKFLHGSRIICLPLNIQKNCIENKKLHGKARRGRNSSPSSLLIRYDTYTKNNIYHSNEWGPPQFFHLDTNPVLVHVQVYFFFIKPMSCL